MVPIYSTDYEPEFEEDTVFLMNGTDMLKPGSDVSSFQLERQDDKEEIQRTGTLWTATAHIITGVIGAGVLSLAWSTAQLGWIAGPLCMIIFAVITLISTLILVECYISDDPEAGPIRHSSLTGVVKYHLGDRYKTICAVFVVESLYGCAIAYTITVTDSISAIQKSNCYHEKGREAHCGGDNSKFMLMFGALQILVSQIPNFHNMAWLSIIAAAMSFTYATIGVGLGLAKTVGKLERYSREMQNFVQVDEQKDFCAENGSISGSLTGISTSSSSEKVWLVFQGLADIAFAYPYSVILLEIQDTLKSPPSETKTMIKSSRISIFSTTTFYLCCGCFGYAAFGDKTPGNLLTGFGFYEPYWLVDFANACIILHLVGGYQIFSQVIFALVEKWFATKYPSHPLSKNLDFKKLPFLRSVEVNSFRLLFRTLYVVTVTGISILFPYFNQVLGVLGALNFWSLGIFFPVEVFIKHKKIKPWSKPWIFFELFSLGCLLISIVGLIGSVQGLIEAKLG